MIKVREEITLNATRQEVWDFLNDIENAATCMPGVLSFVQTGTDCYQAVVTLKVGPIKPKLDGEINILERQPLESMRVAFKGKDKLTRSKLETVANVTFEESAAGVVVAVHADVEILGSLSKYGQGIADKKAAEVAQQFTAAVQERLSPSA